MRIKNKMTRERNRVTKPKKGLRLLVNFATDTSVSGRIIAILHETVSVKKVMNKETKKMEDSIRRSYSVICGSNGKQSRIITKDREIGKVLALDTFVGLYSKQCAKFQRQFHTEYLQAITQLKTVTHETAI